MGESAADLPGGPEHGLGASSAFLFGPIEPNGHASRPFAPLISKELSTNRFGLASDFLSERWSRLRNQSSVSAPQNLVFFCGAPSGRDTNAIDETVSGLLKLLYPGEGEANYEDIERTVHIDMEARRRVKQQHRRIDAAGFRNTRFSYVMGADCVEKFVFAPELQSENNQFYSDAGDAALKAIEERRI
jgi:predicted ATP-dependent Lon-type protease